jgi:hypothetical protein
MGRRKNGFNYGNKHKITWAKVNLIRKLWAGGKFTAKELGIKFNVNCESIIRGKSWKSPHYNRPKFKSGRGKKRIGYHKKSK